MWYLFKRERINIWKTDSDPQKYIYLHLHNVHFKKFPNNMFTLLNKKVNNERLRISYNTYETARCETHSISYIIIKVVYKYLLKLDNRYLEMPTRLFFSNKISSFKMQKCDEKEACIRVFIEIILLASRISVKLLRDGVKIWQAFRCKLLSSFVVLQ